MSCCMCVRRPSGSERRNCVRKDGLSIRAANEEGSAGRSREKGAAGRACCVKQPEAEDEYLSLAHEYRSLESAHLTPAEKLLG